MQHGMIIMWWRPVATIPTGWQICDGTNGLPDLRDKFIKGAAPAADPGAGAASNITENSGYEYYNLVFIGKTGL
jgi:hypothetical protein